MSRRLFSHSLLRDISGVSRKIRLLTGPHTPSSTSGGPDMFPLRLPDVRAPAQYLIDLGLRPALARRISSLYMDFFARYRQVFESCFHRVIHNGCQHPEYYRDIFVVLFKSTFQVWESRIMSTAWFWFCRAEPLPPHLFPDVRVDTATKAQILLRLGHMKTSVAVDDTGPQSIALAKSPPDLQTRHKDPGLQTPEHPEEEHKSEGDATNVLAASPPLLPKSTSRSTRDPLFHEVSSTCFPVWYPPPPCESMSSPRKPLVTRFLTTTSVDNEKLYTNPSVDMSTLVTHFGRMSITTSNACRKTQDSRKCKWGPKSKKPEPLPPLLSPVVADQSNSSPRLSTSNTAKGSCPTSNPAPRKRRIAALPTRHSRITPLPTLDPSSPSAYPPVSLPAANHGAMLRTHFSQVAKTTVTEASLDSSLATVQYGPAQHTTGTSDNPGPESVLSKQRKTRPLPRRAAPHSQILPPQTRPSTPLAPSGQRISFSNVSRTPSLVSDTSSSADTLSSDEFDTPPSAPPSYSLGLAACNPLAANVNSKSNRRGPFGLPISANADPRQGKGVHIDFTNEDAMEERRLSFTFHA